MFDEFVWATGAVLLLSGFFAYARHRDALHPLILVGPFFFYSYFYIPMVFKSVGGLENYLSASRLSLVGEVYLLGVLFFCLGCLALRSPSGGEREASIWRTGGHPMVQRRFRLAAVVLWLAATAVNVYILISAGGFRGLYGKTKAYVHTPSGYISEAPLVAHIAVLLYALSLRGKKVGVRHLVIMVGMETFGLLQGTIGGRRGPLFITLATLSIAWFVARGARPRLRHALLVVLVTGLGLLFVQSQRRTFLRLGSGQDFQREEFWDTVIPKQVNPNHFYMVGAARIIYAEETGRYGWGESLARNLLVRPVPHQLWPGQYMFISELWSSMRGYGSPRRSVSGVLGWSPARGTATGSIADAFSEFSWGMLVVFFLLGQMYGRFWRNFRQRGGVWTVLYGVAIAVSVYLPTQSLAGAFLYRLLLLCVPAYLVWQWLIEPYWSRAFSEDEGRHGRKEGTEEAATSFGISR